MDKPLRTAFQQSLWGSRLAIDVQTLDSHQSPSAVVSVYFAGQHGTSRFLSRPLLTSREELELAQQIFDLSCKIQPTAERHPANRKPYTGEHLRFDRNYALVFHRSPKRNDHLIFGNALRS